MKSVSGMRILFLFIIISLPVILASCRKDVALPDKSLGKLFGRWNWVQTSGGFDGRVLTPASEGYNQSAEFSADGIYKLFKNGDQMRKTKFTLTEGESILGLGHVYMIKFYDAGQHGNEENPTMQSIRFGQHDTLVLTEEAFDRYTAVYTLDR